MCTFTAPKRNNECYSLIFLFPSAEYKICHFCLCFPHLQQWFRRAFAPCLPAAQYSGINIPWLNCCKSISSLLYSTCEQSMSETTTFAHLWPTGQFQCVKFLITVAVVIVSEPGKPKVRALLLYSWSLGSLSDSLQCSKQSRSEQSSKLLPPVWQWLLFTVEANYLLHCSYFQDAGKSKSTGTTSSE